MEENNVEINAADSRFVKLHDVNARQFLQNGQDIGRGNLEMQITGM